LSTVWGTIHGESEREGPGIQAVPHQITLWSGDDTQAALEVADFKEALKRKYNGLCMYGMTDQSLFDRAIGVKR
jgi:hypothetical protein